MAAPAPTAAEKYTVPSVDIDNFSMTFDGKDDGPGPGHYGTEEEAMIAAADWVWVYAQALEQLGGYGRSKEWTTYIFVDAATKKYGFTTPESHAEAHASATDTKALQEKLPDRIGKVIGAMHTHPRGRPTASALAEAAGDGPVAGAAHDYMWETLGGAEDFSPPDRVDAYNNSNFWQVLLTPNGAVKAIQIKIEAQQRFNSLRTRQMNSAGVFDKNKALIQLLKNDDLFHSRLFRPALGPYWQPKRDWWKPRVEVVKRELSHNLPAKGKPKK
jgi:hypothetical protein